ncbi:hypothetical protein ACFHW2_12005 [Actinomadura sp. LOL_016]|uniref:hypothetical protein n=1 Tax=unclassified Actinomadura TaxID=2626254 RepID=UPI003A7FCCCB
MGDQAELDKLVQWAEVEARRLRQVQGLTSRLGSAGFALAHTAIALEFLQRNAPGTNFVRSADQLFGSEGRVSAQGAVTGVADILDAWARSTSESWARILPFEVQARIEAANDLMGQVQQLLEDPKVHPAAPIVLAGAALEEFLRSRIEAKGLALAGRPGINTYAAELKKDGDLSTQEVKDITAWAGYRNHAAHGEWDQFSREEARMMVLGVNLFLQRRTVTS